MISKKRLALIFMHIFILIIIGFLFFSSQLPCASSELRAEKCWIGNAVNSVHNVYAIMDNGTQVGFWATLPPNHLTAVDGVYHGQYITYEWDDANGHHDETLGPIQCEDNVWRYTNVINYLSKIDA